ncbi:MAG: endonuclease/exonuclease/phosphatase family protein [Gammaproteobacteria bacterium]
MAEARAHGEFIAVRDQAVRRGILSVGVVLTSTLLAATLCAAGARYFWLFDLAVHFRVQYAAMGLFGFVVLLIARAPAWALLALVVASWNAMYAAPALVTHPMTLPRVAGEAATGDPVRLRVASINVLYTNEQYSRVVEFVQRERPDAVAMLEMTARWRQALASLDKIYPHRYQTMGVGGRGMTFWTRLPMKDVSVLPIGVRQEPAIQATVEVQGREVRIFAVHTTWPLAPASAARRNQQLELLAERARAVTLPLVVMGDMNITAFSPHFQQLLVDGGLRSAAEGFGWQASWPSFLPPAGIQIDHALVNSRVAVEHFTRGAATGSDHLPIVADLVL